MKKLLATASLAACAIAASPAFAGGDCGASGALGANLGGINPFYYNGNNTEGVTDSGIPHQPAYYGHISTNNTYRFININEAVVTMIGEGKHGLWRTQDNGTVREYIEQNAAGLPEGTDILNPDAATLAALSSQYSHITSHPNFGGYVADGNQIKDGKLQYVDLPINHPKYAGRYVKHVPIDLPSWYCTMSGPEYKYAREAIRFAFAQDGANKVGPLGKRAGMDVKENYLNVLRLEQLPDAQAWANTGSSNNLDWEAIDSKRTPYEIYLIERPFFNEEYLFIAVVFADSNPYGRNFSYIRPEGAYYDHLVQRANNGEELPWFNTQLRKRNPKFAVQQDDNRNGDFWMWGHRSNAKKRISQTNLYGVHHPGGEGKAITNAACPAVGGDFGASYYGGSWPNTYQEATPLCDAILIDIKFYANLDGADWNDKDKYLANAGTDSLTKDYIDVPGVYGAYVDPYLTDRGLTNPEQFTATGTQTKTYQTVRPAVSHNPPLPFTPSIPQ